MVSESLLNLTHVAPPVLTQLDITLQSEQKVGTLGGRHRKEPVRCLAASSSLEPCPGLTLP